MTQEVERTQGEWDQLIAQVEYLEQERLDLFRTAHEAMQDRLAAEVERDLLRQRIQDHETREKQFEKRVLHAATYGAGNRCRSCGQLPNKHRMWCRHYVGPVTHAWHHHHDNFLGGVDWLCSCGKTLRVAEGEPTGAVYECSNATEAWRG